MGPNDFEAMESFQTMYQAYRRAARGKRHKPEVVEFELDLAHNLWQVIDELHSGTYAVGGYERFWIHDPKPREIQALSFRDRVVQHCLCDNILAPWFEPRLIHDNAACQKGKGTHFAMDRLSRFMREHHKAHGTQGYILKYDIRSYFASIDHAVLKRMIASIPDTRVLALLHHIIDSYPGTYDEATELHLEFNDKTQIFPLSQGVDFLGFHFYLTNTGKVVRRLRSQGKRRWKRRLKKFQDEFVAGERSLDAINRSIVSYNGHLEHGDTYWLRKKVTTALVALSMALGAVPLAPRMAPADAGDKTVACLGTSDITATSNQFSNSYCTTASTTARTQRSIACSTTRRTPSAARPCCWTVTQSCNRWPTTIARTHGMGAP